MNALFVKTPIKPNGIEDSVATAVFPAQPAYLINPPKATAINSASMSSGTSVSTPIKGKLPLTNTATEPSETDSFFSETHNADAYPLSATPTILMPSIILSTDGAIAAVGTGGTGTIGAGLIEQLSIAAVGTGGTGSTGMDLIHIDPIAAVGTGGTGGANTGVITTPKPPTQPVHTPATPIILADNSSAVHDPLDNPSLTHAESAPILGSSPNTPLSDLASYANDENAPMDEPTGGTIAVYLPPHNAITQIIQHAGHEQNPVEPAAQTSDATPMLCGTAETGALSVQIYDNGELIGSTAVESNGTWTFTPDHPLSNGAHSFHISSVDVAGQVQSTSALWHITIDTSGQNPSVNTNVTTHSDNALSVHYILDSGLIFDSSELSHELWTPVQQGTDFTAATPEPMIHTHFEASSTLSYMAAVHVEDNSFMLITSSHY